MSTAIVLFRRDLRLVDNPALNAAHAAHERVLPVYIHDPDQDGAWPIGAASRWWLHHSLASLQHSLRMLRTELHLRQGNTLAILKDLIKSSGTAAIYWNRRYEPAAIAHDSRIKAALREQGIEVHSFSASLWFEPWLIKTAQDEPYRVFTPYWRNLRKQLEVTAPLPAPDTARWLQLAKSEALADFELLPRIRWDSGLAEAWQPGEAGAMRLLDLLCDKLISGYANNREIPGMQGTSRLSPHLHFGEISPRQIHYALQLREQSRPGGQPADIEPYLRELGWREFAHHLLYHFPETPTQNFNPRFNNFKWARRNEQQLEAWRRGQTGIPLVDAGMRELWHTGWMHNRVRMVVASFLTKNLRQHWLHGARWFWDTLVDADLANNTLGWQWVAGCGADAAPYFRIFNPVTQARKFDPDGVYLRRWLPELARLQPALQHEPWLDASALSGIGYPVPIADPGSSRQAALQVYQAWRET